jgi:hypothetical protein
MEQSNSSDAINFVSRTTQNNGVSAKILLVEGLEPAEAGTISVALGGEGGAAQSFLQPYPYYCGRDVMILIAKKPMSDNEKLWWASCITANHFRFGFGRQANRTLKDIVLPEPEAMPDWVSQADIKQYEGFEAPASDAPTPLLSPLSWRRYKLSELFNIRKGKRLTKANMWDGQTPFIGAVDKNNGVTSMVGQQPIHEGNTITVNYNGSVAEAFYQPKPFWCSDDVNVLYPKFELTPVRALFIATVIRLERYRFNYGRKWHLERMEPAVIRLPAKADGSPDWQYMEHYINTLPFSSQLGTVTSAQQTRTCGVT